MDTDKKLFEIMQKFIDMDRLPQLWESGKELSLTGKEWQMDAIDLVYLFLEVEKTFHISIDTSKIGNYGFNTVTGIERFINGIDS